MILLALALLMLVLAGCGADLPLPSSPRTVFNESSHEHRRSKSAENVVGVLCRPGFHGGVVSDSTGAYLGCFSDETVSMVESDKVPITGKFTRLGE